MPSRSPLSSFPVVRSSDPELVRDRLFQVCGATSFDIGKGRKGFEMIADHLQIGGLGLSYCDYAGDVSLGFGEASFVRQFFNIEGTGRFVAGRDRGRRFCPRRRRSGWISRRDTASSCCASNVTRCCEISVPWSVRRSAAN